MKTLLKESSQKAPAKNSLAICGLSFAVFIASLDTAITNTALPFISEELNTAFAASIWVVNSYQLVMVALILPLAVLADQLSYKLIFLMGLFIFTLASFLCGDANTINELIFARAVQGLGAAAILGTNIALVRLIYSPEKLGIGLGINAFIIAAGLAGGPVISSMILTQWSWHWLFFINIPVGICALLFSYFLPHQQQSANRKFNFVSAILTIVMFSSIIYGLGEMAVSNSWGWATICIVIGCISGLLLVKRDSKHLHPIFPVDLFQGPIFSLSVITAFFAFITQGLVLVALPYIFSKTGYSEGEVGFLIAPWPIMGAIMAPIAGFLSNKISAAYLGAVGLVLLGTSISSLAFFQGDIASFLIIIAMIICGLGFGLFLTPNQRMLMSNAPINRSGAAGGMLNVARTSGQAVGVALVGLSINLNPNNLSIMLWVGASFALIASIISIFRIIKG